jgi:hypothetical protein
LEASRGVVREGASRGGKLDFGRGFGRDDIKLKVQFPGRGCSSLLTAVHLEL